MSNSPSLLEQLTVRWSDSLHSLSPWAHWMGLSGLGVILLLTHASSSLHDDARGRVRLLSAVPLALAVMYWAYQLRWVGDDAFISFRYAWNLTEGNGLVFNPGERVEGYTNFLWTLLIALGLKLGVNPVLSSLTLSLLSLGAVVVQVAWLSGKLTLGDKRSPISLAAIACAGTYLLAEFGTSGLETMFAAALVLLMLTLAMKEKWLASAIAGIGAALSHPDHLLYYFALAAALLSDPLVLKTPTAWLKDPVLRRRLLHFSAPFFLVFVPYYIARAAYYGDLHPNTYYAKSGHLTYFEQGNTYIWVTVFATSSFFTIPLSLFGAWQRVRSIPGRFFLFALPVFCFYCAKIGGDFMLGRVLVTLIPLCLIFAEVCLRDLASRQSTLRVALLSFLTAGFFLSSLPTRVIADGEKFFWVSDERTFYPIDELSEQGVRSHYKQRASDLKEHVVAHGISPLLGAGNVGVVGYLSGVRIVDLLALTDREVAHMPIRERTRPGHEKIARGAYLLKRQVDLSDDPIFPDPYNALTEGRVGRTRYFLSGYKFELMKAFESDKAVHFPNPRRQLKSYAKASPDLDQVACDAWFYDVFYFRHQQQDHATRKRFLNDIESHQPSLKGFSELFLRYTAPTRFLASQTITFEVLDGSNVHGVAFTGNPVRGLVPDQGFVEGEDGPFLNSFHPMLGDAPTGSLTTKSFVLNGDAMTIDVGGGKDGVRAELLVDDRVVHSAAGCDAEMLGRKVWPLKELKGKSARLRFVDNSGGRWGHLMADTATLWSRTEISQE